MILNSFRVNQPIINNRLINNRFISYNSFNHKSYNLLLKHKLFIFVFSLYLVKFLIGHNLFGLVLSFSIAFLITNFVLKRISLSKNLFLNIIQRIIINIIIFLICNFIIVDLNYNLYFVIVPCFMIFKSEGYITFKHLWYHYCSDDGSDPNYYYNNSNDIDKNKNFINNTNNSGQTNNTKTSNASEISVEKADTLDQLDGSNETPSPDSSMIMSPLEPSADSAPLEVLIGYLLTLNVIDLVLTICLLLVIFDRFYYRISLEKINSFISRSGNNKYFPNFFKKWFSKYTIRSVNITNIFTLVMFIVIAFLFIYSKLLGIFISYELYNNLEDFVGVYNYFKNISKSSICLFIISSNPLLSKFFLKNHPQNYSPYKLSFIKSKKRQKY